MLNNTESGKTNKNAVLTALLINILTALICFVVFSPVFETNDDCSLIGIASGVRGVRDAHMVHSNYVFGKLMTALYSAFPDIQWWSLLQIALIFIAFFLVALVFIKNVSGIANTLLIAAVIFFFSYEGYVRIQYTKTAGLLSAAGFIVLFYGLLRRDMEKRYILAGALLALAGSFFRIQEFVCIAAVFAAMVVYGALYCKDEMERPQKRVIAALAVGAALLIAVGGFRVYDRSQYKDPAWSAYLEFDKYRTEVIDYGVPDYDEHEEEYNSIGIDRTAYKLMKDWTFQDSEKFTAETFKTIAGFKEKKTVNAAFIRNFMRSFARDITKKEGTFLCFLIAAAVWIFTGRHKLRNILSLLVMCAVIAALNFYLYYAGRFMVNRVDAGIWLAAVLILLYQSFLDRSDSIMYEDAPAGAVSAAKTVVAVLMIAAMAASFVLFMPWKSSLRSAQGSRLEEALKERAAVEQVGNDKDHLYLTKVGTLKISEAYGVMDPVPYKIADNIYPLGGWSAGSPVFTDVLKRHGVDNPFRDMIGNGNVYLIDKDIDSTLAYLRKWYKADAEAEIVDSINGQNIYRIR